MRSRIPILLTPLLTVAGSLTAFVVLLEVYRPGWDSREHAAFTVWSLPLAVLVTAVAVVLRVWLRGRSGWIRAGAALVAGLLAGAGWAFGSYYLSGGYVLAFDAPVLYCWSAGGVAALSVALFWPDMRRPASHTAGA